jgi:hypothetical protein
VHLAVGEQAGITEVTRVVGGLIIVTNPEEGIVITTEPQLDTLAAMAPAATSAVEPYKIFFIAASLLEALRKRNRIIRPECCGFPPKRRAPITLPSR